MKPTLVCFVYTLDLLAWFAISSTVSAMERVKTDLLVVGATESGWAASIQAARSGVKDITIVHDGDWFGGQFTEQGLACVDENKGVGKIGWGVDWHPMKRSFHRSGLFKELMDRIESFNEKKYGSTMPGRPWHGPSTFRPAEAEAVFREMIQPYLDSGQIRVFWRRYPVEAVVERRGSVAPRLRALDFAEVDLASGKTGDINLRVEATLTIDASDWGDAIQVSGTAFECGPDPQSRYGEASAPEKIDSFPKNEMNPITWAMIVVRSEEETPIEKPKFFDDRNYPRATHFSRDEFANLQWDVPKPGLGAILHWPDAGEVARRQLSVYTVRRVIEGTTSETGETAILLNYMNGQDYPLERLPKRVADALESSEPGASEKNIVRMSREQRQIIFEDAKRHAKGVLYHLQNFVHDHAPDKTNSFRRFHLSREFGTADSLPPKPYIREGLRLKAMYMIREQDGRNRDGETKIHARPRFAEVMYPDGLFAWQFHYDFHRTGRTYLIDEGKAGPWIDYHKSNRHTKFLSDRCVFPLRSLVPESMNGLLGAQGNVGFSSIVSAAVRLHDQRIHIGQAAGATAAICLRKGIDARCIPYDGRLLSLVRDELCSETMKGTPLLLWPFRDLAVGDAAFIAANRMAARGLLPMEARDVDFQSEAEASNDWTRLLAQQIEESTFPNSFVGYVGTTRGGLVQYAWRELIRPHLSVGAVAVTVTDDSDMDGIPDSEDPYPLKQSERVVFEIKKIEPTPETDGIPDQTTLSDDFPLYNFGDRSQTVSPRMIRDVGNPFDKQVGHGWLRDLRSNLRQRNILEGPHDSFVFTRQTDTWECALAKGTYRVVLCLGDSGYDQMGQSITIEGNRVVENRDTQKGSFLEKGVDVEVADGLLTVTIGSGSGSNTCLNWIHILPLP